MHTRLFGTIFTYVILFTFVMNLAGLATFPPEEFEIPINFSRLVFWLPNIETSVTFSWSNVVSAIMTIALTVVVIVAAISLVAQSLDMAYVVKIVLGTAVTLALGTTVYATIGTYVPSWLHLFFVYLPCALMIYSVLDIGGD